MRIKIGIICALIGISSIMFSHSHTVRHHDAHVHGKSDMNIFLDQNNLMIEVIIPAIDIVGFEHKPRTEKQKQKIVDSKEFLQDVSNVLAINPELEYSSFEATVVLDYDDKEADKHHKHEHSDFHIKYEYVLNHSRRLDFLRFFRSPRKIDSIKVVLFEKYPSLEEVAVQIATFDNQSFQKINPNNNEISFRDLY